MAKAKNSGKAKKSAPKAKKVVEQQAPEPTPVKEVAPVQEEAAPQEDLSVTLEQWDQEFQNIYNQLSSWKTQMSEMTANVRRFQRQVQKELRTVHRKNKKANAKRSKREPSGFAKPCEISKDLCDFLNKPYGTELARTEVTKHLTEYIRNHNLQDPVDKRHILPDTKLNKLLNAKKGDMVTYFNLQKWMKPHFSSAAQSAQSSQ